MAYTLSISAKQNSQNIINNTSNVTVSVIMTWEATVASYNSNQCTGHCVINGTSYTFTSSFNTSKALKGSQTLYTTTVNVGHNSDGTKTLSMSADFDTRISVGKKTASASLTLTRIPTGAVSLSIGITENSWSATTNTSNVTVNVTASSSGYAVNGTQSGSCTINGTAYSFTNNISLNNSSKVIFTKQLDIAHNADGTKTLSTSASYATGLASGTVSASASKVLTTIPRASSISSVTSSVAVGGKVTVSISPASDAFRHKVEYLIGSTVLKTVTGVAKSTEYTIENSWLNYITTSTSATATVRVTTYPNSTSTSSIGTATKNFTVTVPASYVPTISNKSVSDAMSYADKYGAYIKGYSKIRASFTSAGASGSTIKSNSITINGVSYSGTSATTGEINASGTVNVVFNTSDSRGRTASSTHSPAPVFYDYAKPKINLFSVSRCNADGTPNDGGTYAKVTYDLSIDNINNQNINTKSAVVTYKKVGSTTTNTYTIDMSSSYEVSGIVPIDSIGVVDENASYEFELVLQDDLSNDKRSMTLSTAETVMDFLAGGKGVAIGKVATQNGLDVGWDATFRGNAILDSNKSIQYIGTGGLRNMIQFKNATDQWGDGIIIGGGGLTIIGGGEAADTVATQYTSMGSEEMIVAGDGAIKFYSNCQDGMSKAKMLSISQSGRLERDAGGSYVADRDNVVVLGIHRGQTAGTSYNPALGQLTTSGCWTIGNLSGEEHLSFNYTTNANYSAGSNKSVRCWITSAGVFTSASLRELKENIETFDDNAVDLINDIEVCSFNMKEDPEKAYRVGFIADDTNPIFSGKEQNCMDTNNCVGVLIKAVQELSSQVNVLKEKIRILEEK